MNKLSVQPLLYGGVEHDPGQEHLDGQHRRVLYQTRGEIGVIILFNVLYEIFTGDAPNMPEICTYVLDLVLPVLYTFCAWLNWRHKGDDTPKAADADPAPASKS